MSRIRGEDRGSGPSQLLSPVMPAVTRPHEMIRVKSPASETEARGGRLMSSCRIVAIALLVCGNSLAGDTETIGTGSEVTGQVADIHSYTNSSGYRFQVALRGLSYVGQADRTVLERKEDGSLTIWLAFRDVRLTIGRISMSGEPGSATCGPTALRIGHQREVWVAFDFDHRAETLRSLTFSGSRCQIENDNWAIGSPAWVRTSGLFMSQGKVVSGVRTGLAGKRARIEQELQNIAYEVLGKSFSDSDEAPADRDAFEDTVEARLVHDGYLTDSRSVSGGVSLPLTGFTRDVPDLTRQD